MLESDTEREERAALEQSIAALRTELRALPVTQANSVAIQRLHRSLADVEGQIADVDVGYPSAVFIAPILRVIQRVELPEPDDVLATLQQFGLYDPAQESIWVITFDAVLQLRKVAETGSSSQSGVLQMLRCPRQRPSPQKALMSWEQRRPSATHVHRSVSLTAGRPKRRPRARHCWHNRIQAHSRDRVCTRETS